MASSATKPTGHWAAGIEDSAWIRDKCRQTAWQPRRTYIQCIASIIQTPELSHAPFRPMPCCSLLLWGMAPWPSRALPRTKWQARQNPTFERRRLDKRCISIVVPALPTKKRKHKKDSQLIIRINGLERNRFIDLCNKLDTSAAREIRRFIRDFMQKHADRSD